MTATRASTSGYPIRAVARMTGLTVDTLRAWERRYDAVTPGRGARGRLYTDVHVTRLKQLAALVDRGHAIGTIVQLSDSQLKTLLTRVEAHTGESAGSLEPVAAPDPLLRALERYDLEVIEGILNRHAAVLPPRELVFTVIIPLLREIGRRWEAGRLRPSQEHMVSAIVRSVLGGLLRTLARPHASPTIICATPSGERHELGVLCAAVLAASAGFDVIYLGSDVPGLDLQHAAATTTARVVLLSATTPGVVPKREWRHLAALSGSAEVWIGGPEAGPARSMIGDRVREVTELEHVIPMLARLSAT